jgi:hypothetical protein
VASRSRHLVAFGAYQTNENDRESPALRALNIKDPTADPRTSWDSKEISGILLEACAPLHVCLVKR